MAKKVFTLLPNVYFTKQLAKGGRNEIPWTIIGTHMIIMKDVLPIFCLWLNSGNLSSMETEMLSKWVPITADGSDF